MGGMSLLTHSAGASAIQCPIAKGLGHGGCSKRKTRVGSAMLRFIDKAGETTKLPSWTLGKIYDQLINNQKIYKENKRTYYFFVSW